MNDHGPWSTRDFDSMSWHDVHVHGFRLESYKEDEGTADLALDIDYLLEWKRSGDQCLFSVCRAELRFHEVFGLNFRVDYAGPTAGMAPFSIDGIEREILAISPETPLYRWRILINWPTGRFEFQAPRFSQKLIGKPTLQDQQALMADDRNERD